jgi:HAD superfamily hydrolase (TIGR01490 family)
MTSTGSAAIFDLDNTLVRGSSLFHFGTAMVRRGMVSPFDVLRFVGAEASYVRRRSERAGMPSTVAERTLGLVAGRRQADLARLARDWARTSLSRHLVAEVRLQLTDFRRLGFTTVLATASPQELADAVADQLGMTAAIGTVSETCEGVYTGRPHGPIAHGSSKAWRVQALLESRGLDPRTSWAFSDSVNDLPLLSSVGNPVATNPDPELAAIARLNGWRILESRAGVDLSTAQLHSLFPFPY